MPVPEGLEKVVLKGTPVTRRTSEVLSPPDSLSVKKSKMGDDMPSWTKNFSKMVMEQLKEEVFNPFKAEILGRMEKLEGQVEKITELSTTFNGDEIKRVEKSVSDLSKDNSFLEVRVNQLFEMVDNERREKALIVNKLTELEDRQRRDNLVFEGVPDTKGETPRECVTTIRIQVCKFMEVLGWA